MNTNNLSESMLHLEALKKESQQAQKKGLPFIMSSVVIWVVILMVQLMDVSVVTRNLYTFMSCCLLLPLAFLFSKIIKADTFRKTKNPMDQLGFLCTMNQMLYLLIVMWAYSKAPEAMVMLYAMVFGGHLFPFGWVYDSKAYTIVAVMETVGALIMAVAWGSIAAVLFMIIMEILLCIFLFIEVGKDRK